MKSFTRLLSNRFVAQCQAKENYIALFHPDKGFHALVQTQNLQTTSIYRGGRRRSALISEML